jgi:hypothetical protein
LGLESIHLLFSLSFGLLSIGFTLLLKLLVLSGLELRHGELVRDWVLWGVCDFLPWHLLISVSKEEDRTCTEDDSVVWSEGDWVG